LTDRGYASRGIVLATGRRRDRQPEPPLLLLVAAQLDPDEAPERETDEQRCSLSRLVATRKCIGVWMHRDALALGCVPACSLSHDTRP
jgi:hypothetical protein